MRLGIDLGGTKIEIIALDEDGNTLHRLRIATPQNDYLAILKSITRLVESTETKFQQTATVGICTPGSIAPDGSPASGLLRNSNSVCLNGKTFKQDIERCLNRKIAIANDPTVLRYQKLSTV